MGKITVDKISTPAINVRGFGGLVRVMNKRQEFLWVHERFTGEY
jgi:hypothetical protein